MQVTSCHRRPAQRRVIPGSSPSNYEHHSTTEHPRPHPQHPPSSGQERGEGRPRVRQYGREDAVTDTARRWRDPDGADGQSGRGR